MEIKGKVVLYGALILVVFLLLLFSLGVFDLSKNKTIQSVSKETGGIPEKCQIPEGQEIDSWKEHLGHHAETKDCLKYFN
ncbi:MAG: hypothetical protein AABW89_03030 [Nanoarchaeota archaeon]